MGTSNLLVVDTTNSRIAIGQASSAYTLEVNGDINSTTGIRVGGALLCSASGCSAASGNANYIQNSLNLQTANFNIQSVATTSVTGIIRATSAQTADLLQLKDNLGTNVVTIGPTGNTLIQPSTNSVSAFQVLNKNSTSHLIIGDTLNARVAIAKVTPTYTLDVGGDINSTTGLRVAGNLVCSTVCTPGGGSGDYIQNGTALQSANFNIQSKANGSIAASIKGYSGQTADLLDLVSGDMGTNVVSFGASGQTVFQNSTNSTTAFQIQNAAGNPYLLVNTSGASISVGDTSIASTIQIGNTTGAVAQTINLGNNATGSSTTNVTIGNLLGASTTTIQGGSGNINLLSTGNIVIGTSDTTGTLLVLDTKTGAGDPTGVNGGLYYNSNSNTLRAYLNSAWDDLIPAAGWTGAGETWTYASADAPTFTFTISGDLTGKYYAGQRIKLTQTTAKYFIITAVSYSNPNTTVTVYGVTDYTLANSAISANFYSAIKAPAGFPMDPNKWTVEFNDANNRTQATPTQNTWYNLASALLSIPIGAWNVEYQVNLYNDTAGKEAEAALSTANNSRSDADLNARVIGVTGNVSTSVYRRKAITLASKTTYYLNVRTQNAGVGNILTLGGDGSTIIRAVSAYL
ncbi:MAG: hypothetical protein AAB896_01410 [Patescibacteria group bacterium]